MSGVFVCSVTSNCTGRFVFFWMMVARSRIELPDHRSSTLSLTRSQAWSLLSMAKVEQRQFSDRPAHFEPDADRPNVLWLERSLLADQNTLVPWISIPQYGGVHAKASATPPTASPPSGRPIVGHLVAVWPEADISTRKSRICYAPFTRSAGPDRSPKPSLVQKASSDKISGRSPVGS